MDFIFNHSKLVGVISAIVGALFILTALQSLLIGDLNGFVVNGVIGAGLGWLGLWLFKYEDRLNAHKRAELLRKQQEQQEQALRAKRYFDSIAPKDWVSYMQVNIDDTDAKINLGQENRKIQFMFINQSKIITFPESKFGETRGYYLISVDFDMKNQESFGGNSSYTGQQNGTIGMNGASVNYNHTNSNGYVDNDGFYSGSGNSYGGGAFSANGSYSGYSKMSGNFSGKINKDEIPTNAFLTFVTTDKQSSFKVRLNGEVENRVNNIKQYFLLNDFEQKKLNFK